NEVYLGLSVGMFTLKTSYATSNYFGVDDSDGTIYYNLSGEFPLSDSTSISAAVGYVDPKGGVTKGYDYSLGISTDLNGFSLGASYISTSGDLNDSTSGTKEIAKGTVVVSISKSF
ncbi:MAG: TorF family putative porin, partial [Burkholderiaceae bacterium]